MCVWNRCTDKNQQDNSIDAVEHGGGSIMVCVYFKPNRVFVRMDKMLQMPVSSDPNYFSKF